MSIKKRTFVILFVVFFVAIVAGFVCYAKAETYTEGVVQSSRVSIREAPDTKANRIVSLVNGEPVEIVGQQGDWYLINLLPINGIDGVGYALKWYFDTNGYYLTVPVEVFVYVDPFGTTDLNGEKSAGTTFRVLNENESWYVVQLNDGQAGSGFIRKADLAGKPSTPGSFQNSTSVSGGFRAVVTADTLALREKPDDSVEPFRYYHNGDVVQVLEWGDYFVKIASDRAGQPVAAYVHTQWLQRILE